MAMEVAEVRITLYGKGGIAGFAEVVVKDETGALLRLGDIAIKRTKAGKLMLSYAKKNVKTDMAFWNPLSKEMARRLEKAIFEHFFKIKNFIPENLK